jgi:hypothetical protein
MSTHAHVFIDFSLSRSTLTIYGISQDNDAKPIDYSRVSDLCG